MASSPSLSAVDRETAIAINKPFDPRTEISADAKYLLRNLLTWFFFLPLIAGVILVALFFMLR